ncbi:MAG: toprim domain-containing protein [Candidatus Pacebacteria bacterium]|nr:toprim domain-containing protein [Candidatus Paceibacterota bacterium]
MEMNNRIDKLAYLFESFPGIGKRQARRFVYFLLHKDPGYIHELTSSIQNVKAEIDQCHECYRFFPKTGMNICPICIEAKDSKQLMIVEKDADFENLHKTKIYEGKYFILGGHINANEKKRSFARVDQLINRIKRDTDNGVIEELIFALSISPEAEHTRIRLYTMLKDTFPNLTFSTLGRGLSTGTELEYSDTETLKHAFNSRITQ